MTEPSGSDALSVRRRYLHQRVAERGGDRGAAALWLGIGTCIASLFLIGLIGMAH